MAPNLEDNLYTIKGLGGKAAECLWDMIKHDRKLRNRVLSILDESSKYYKALDSVVDFRIRKHLCTLVQLEADNIGSQAYFQKDISTFLRNVLKQMYKKNLQRINEEQREYTEQYS